MSEMTAGRARLRSSSVAWAMIGLSLILLLVACVLPAVWIHQTGVWGDWGRTPGLVLLVVGALVVSGSNLGHGFGWLANPLCAVALVSCLTGRWGLARPFSLIAALIAVTWSLVASARGIELLATYWLWLASIASLVGASFVGVLGSHRH